MVVKATPIPIGIRQRVFERDAFCCLYCKSGQSGLEIHHRQGRLARRGQDPHRMSGLVLLCPSCHLTATTNPEWAYQLGLSVRRVGLDETDEIPFADCYGMLWRLNDAGDRFRIMGSA